MARNWAHSNAFPVPVRLSNPAAHQGHACAQLPAHLSDKATNISATKPPRPH